MVKRHLGLCRIAVAALLCAAWGLGAVEVKELDLISV